jgi:hypothetical protein
MMNIWHPRTRGRDQAEAGAFIQHNLLPEIGSPGFVTGLAVGRGHSVIRIIRFAIEFRFTPMAWGT